MQPPQQHRVHTEEVHRQDALGRVVRNCFHVGPDRRGANRITPEDPNVSEMVDQLSDTRGAYLEDEPPADLRHSVAT